jgi:glycosyltransferase involved in cell wall biosynthesis
MEFDLLIIVIEKDLDHASGHHQTQIKAIKGLFRNEKIEIFTAINSRINLPLTDDIHRVLTNKREQKYHSEKSVRHDVTVLQKILTDVKYLRCKGVLIPTAETHEILVCLKLIKVTKSLPKFILRVLTSEVIKKLTKAQRKELYLCIESGLIILVTETQSLERLLFSRYNLRAYNKFLLPCSIDPNDHMPLPSARNQTHFRIGYLGGFRREKGANKLLKILADLRSQLNDSGTNITMELVMQTPRHKTVLRRLIYNYKLRGILHNSLDPGPVISMNILDERLSDQAFVDAVYGVDILVIPYDLKAYQCRGSGMIIDGVLAKKPIIYTDGIGMEEFLRFGNAESATDIVEFAPKIMKVVQNLPTYLKNANLAHKAMSLQIKKSTKVFELTVRETD